MVKRIFLSVVAGLASCTLASAQASVHVEAFSDGLRFRGGGVAAPQSWTIVIPDDSASPITSWTVGSWKMLTVAAPRDTQSHPVAAITAMGRWNGRPLARLDLRPWRTRLGMIDVAQDWTVEIRFPNHLRAAVEPLVVAPWMPPCANPLFAPIHLPTKFPDFASSLVNPGEWLETGQPIVRLRTRQHGIASTSARTVIATEPRLLGVSVACLALYYQGKEQPIHVFDADGSGTLTDVDDLIFIGREPVDSAGRPMLWDTTAVFFLTSSSDCINRRRFSPLYDTSIEPSAQTPWLYVQQRIELDTGFYHLGSGAGADFTSETALFEGFYWHHFTAAREGFGRFSHREMLYPARSGEPFTIGAIYNTLTSTRAGGTEHRVELAINGGSTVHQESSGFEQHRLDITRPSAAFPLGSNLVTIYSPGIRSRWGQPDYQSWVGLEAITVSGPIEPIAHRGRLTGNVVSATTPSKLHVHGFRSSEILTIDTIQHLMGWSQLHRRGIVATASATPSELPSVFETWPEGRFRAEIIVGDSVIIWPEAPSLCFVAHSPNDRIQKHASESEEQALTFLRQLPAGTIVAGTILSPSSMSISIRTWLQEQGAVVPNAQYIAVVGSVGNAQSWKAEVLGTLPEARGGTFAFIEAAWGRQFSGQVHLPGTDRLHLVMGSYESFERALVEPAVLHDLRLERLDADVIFITHPLHRAATEKLAEHRRRHTGMRTHIVDVHAIRDEFGYGTLSPESVKNYLHHAVMSLPASQRPHYLVLVGAASWDPRLAVKFGNVGARLPDQIPTYGRPSSDYWYGLLEPDGGFANPHLVVGRLPALTSEQSMFMVDKIIRQDTQSFEPWMRRMLYVGTDDQLCGIYRTLLEDPLETGYTITGAPLCIDTITMCRYGSPPSAGFEIRRHLNAGVQFMHFHGHGAPGIFEIPAWDAPDIDNADRLGFLGTYSCQTGAFSNPSIPCKNATFLMEPDRGFVGVIGGTGWGFTLLMDILHFRVHDGIRSQGLRRIGDILYRAKTPFGADRTDAQAINTVMQQSLLGDPLSRVKIDTIPDPYIRAQDVRTTAPNGSLELTQDLDDVIVTITLRNAGTATSDPVRVRVIRTWNGASDTVYSATGGPLCSWLSVRCTLDVTNKIGRHVLDITIDDDDVIPDLESNNRVITAFDVRSNSLVPVEPQTSWIIPEQGASIRMLDAKPQAGSDYQIVISRNPTTDAQDVVVASTPEELRIHEDGIIDWTPQVRLPAGSAWIGTMVARANTPSLPSTSWFPIVVGASTNRATIPGRFFRPESHTLSIKGDDMSLVDPVVRINVISAGTDTAEQDYRRFPTLRMSVGHELGSVRLIENPYYRGFNLLMIPDNDSVPRAWRRFDTYVYPDSSWTCCLDGFAPELLAFLADSLRDDERVIIALCNESLSAFTQTNRLDTLFTLLQRLGAARLHELREGSSYILLGRLGMQPGQAVERLSNEFNTAVELDTTLSVLPSPASALIGPIGPARLWRSVELTSASGSDTLRTELVIRDSNGGFKTIHRFPSGVGPFQIPTVAQDQQRLYIRTTIYPASNRTERAVISSLNIDYVPANEWSISSNSTTIDEILRGDTARIAVDVRNLMISYPSQTTSLVADVEGGTVAASERIVVPVPPLGADSRSTVYVPVPTARTESPSTVSLELNIPPVDLPELYRFNNTLSVPLTIREDDVPPNVRLEVDGRWAIDGMYAVQRPLMRVFLHDNSWLAITDSTRINVFINGDRMRPAVVDDWAFYPTVTAQAQFPGHGSSLRAVVQFRYGLDRGQNTVIIRSQDASGNRDTTELSIYTGDGIRVQALTVEPNPVKDNARFVIDLAAPTNDNSAVIDIYNVEGTRVATIPLSIGAGRTMISWDARGIGGTSLPQGAYYYRCSLGAVDNTVISTGTFVIMR